MRLNGTYHDGNEKHLSTNLIAEVTFARARGGAGRLTVREYALAAVAAGATVLALLPLLLHLAGTRWRPGVRAAEGR